MKKIFLSAVLAATSWGLFAQNTTGRNNSTMNNTTTDQWNSNTNQNMNATNQTYNTTSTSNYSAYGIPNHVQMNVQTNYPYASNLTWDRPTADWYHGYFSDNNGRYTHVYYSTDPYYNSQYNPERVTGYSISLPVLQTWVPDAVITTALNQYKQNLYDITGMKGNNAQDIYLIRVQDNGELKSMWMDANGTAVTDMWRTDDQMNMNNTSNNAAKDNSSSNTKKDQDKDWQ
jgi:hypothetical protein